MRGAARDIHEIETRAISKFTGNPRGFRARLKDGFQMSEVPATNAETGRRPRRLIDSACNARCSYRELLSGSFAVSGTPAYDAAIQSADFTGFSRKSTPYVMTKCIPLLQSIRSPSYVSEIPNY